MHQWVSGSLLPAAPAVVTSPHKGHGSAEPGAYMLNRTVTAKCGLGERLTRWHPARLLEPFTTELSPTAGRQAECLFEMPVHVTLVRNPGLERGIDQGNTGTQLRTHLVQPAHRQVPVRTRTEMAPECACHRVAIEAGNLFVLCGCFCLLVVCVVV